MKTDNKTAVFYNKLKKQLYDQSTWPSIYLYKFIIPSSLKKLAIIESVFNNTNAIISTRESSKGTYISVSVKVNMESPEAVIEKYIEVSKVEGVISL